MWLQYAVKMRFKFHYIIICALCLSCGDLSQENTQGTDSFFNCKDSIVLYNDSDCLLFTTDSTVTHLHHLKQKTTAMRRHTKTEELFDSVMKNVGLDDGSAFRLNVIDPETRLYMLIHKMINATFLPRELADTALKQGARQLTLD